MSFERTQVIAAYAGRISKKKVDLGQVVLSNRQLTTIFVIDYVEIRLPIKNNDLALISLSALYRDIVEQGSQNDVVLTSDLIGIQSLKEKIIRTNSGIDEESQ